MIRVLPQLIITFREAFEALILIVIVSTFLSKTGRIGLKNFLYYGGILAFVFSLAIGFVSREFLLSLDIEKGLVEAVAAFIAVPIVTGIIVWMAIEGPKLKKSIEQRVSLAVRSKRVRLAVLFMGFVFVFREGIETVLFLSPIYLGSPVSQTVYGVFGGLFLALLLSLGISRASLKLNLRKFFFLTSLLLIFIASGILGYGVHEFMEYLSESKGMELGVLGKELYSIGLSESSVFHEKGIVGSILSILFGYTTEMEMGRFIVQFSYLVIGLAALFRVYGFFPMKMFFVKGNPTDSYKQLSR